MTNQSKDEILKLALEAAEIGLANLTSYQSAPRGPTIHEYGQAVLALIKVREAKATLAQPAQECPNIKNCGGACFQCEYFNAEKGEMEYPVVQPAQDPMAWTDENVIAWCLKRGIEAAKDAPPQCKPWVGLTDAEIKKLSDDCVGVRDETEFIRAIEQALKEKNT